MCIRDSRERDDARTIANEKTASNDLLLKKMTGMEADLEKYKDLQEQYKELQDKFSALQSQLNESKLRAEIDKERAVMDKAVSYTHLDVYKRQILIRDDDFSCAKAVAEAAKNHPKITVLTNTEVICVEGDHMLRRICYRNRNTGKETLFDSANDTFGVFVFAGYEPNTSCLLYTSFQTRISYVTHR